MTTRAALEAVRRRGPARLVSAVPVGAAETVSALADRVDDLVVLAEPRNFMAVGYWYWDFEQLTDDDVVFSPARASASP